MGSTPSVVIIGAGFGGLAAAIELKRNGIETFTVLERHDHVGGVWQANEYPGAACDVPSIIYQFSYALNGDWKHRYGRQAEIREYLGKVSSDFGIDPHVRFNTEVSAATFHEDAGTWEVTTAGGETLTADVVICATGQLSQPAIPPITGLDGFTGQHMHSAEWDPSVDIKGKKVAVVGGGASAIQLVPTIVDEVEHLTVIQRDPSWIVNKYDWKVGPAERALMKLPGVARLYHDLMWWWFEVRAPSIKTSFDWLRGIWAAERRRHIKKTLKDPKKVAAATPDYTFGCNRLLLSNDWYPTLAREDVDLLGEAVTEMTPTGLVCGDGTTVEADVVIWCTGFKATEYLSPIDIVGRDGLHIREAWSDGPEAYLGLTTPGFPNLFMSYGPNTGSLTNSIVYLVERQAAYMRQAVEHLGRTGGWIDVRPDVHDAFNARLQERMQGTSFASGCPGWYTTDSGKVTQVWVGSHIEYGHRTREFDPGVYEQHPVRALASA
ncbi:MAG: NAD(P)/FAD-dependent oxidoreductase [Solirubrobacteraceae bacterium]|nr:NAD(P)/FAD-dependent oxidoreductase [Solirubrobacteraceae bacterium]